MFQNPLPQMPAAPLPSAGAGLLLRALFKRGTGVETGAPVPATVFSCSAPGPDALAHYNACLGFAPGARPVSAHYLLVQRAHLATMLARDFPFRLLGMVHVENSIVEHAPLAPGTLLRLETSVQVASPTRSGARFCTLETLARNGAGPVFGCVSKYLAVAGRSGAVRAEPAPLPALPEFGAWQLAHGDGRRYARVSGDWNPIHLARPAARLFGLRAPIIHGMHSVGRALALLEAHGGRVVSVEVRFRSTVPLGARVRMLHAPGSGGFALVCEGRVAVEGKVVFASV